MTDPQGRIVTRDVPEDILLNKLEQCKSLRSMVDLLIWTLGEKGLKRFAKAADDRLQAATADAKATAEQATETEISTPRKSLRSLKDAKS